MTITLKGTPKIPNVSAGIQSSAQDEMDSAIEALQTHKDEWVNVSIHERIGLID